MIRAIFIVTLVLALSSMAYLEAEKRAGKTAEAAPLPAPRLRLEYQAYPWEVYFDTEANVLIYRRVNADGGGITAVTVGCK